jgi:hypothetical protein
MHILTYLDPQRYHFEWSIGRELQNILKHGVSFMEAREAFFDPEVVHTEDLKHSRDERRWYLFGKNVRGEVLTVRYTIREEVIRIFGAARWRKGRKIYENAQSKKLKKS